MYAELAREVSARGELVLRRRTGEKGATVLELRANGICVMDSQESSTETELAAAALALVEQPRRVVVGGLGLGFTLRRVLADPRVEQVTVVEIEEALVEWLRDGTVPHGPELLADTRIRLVVGDVATAIAEARSTCDLVLLDVDNGPGYLVHEHNAALYRHDFLAGVRRVLEPGGVLVVWSADRSPDLRSTLEQVFGNCAEHRHEVLLGTRAEEYVLYLSRRG